jgi:galactokinase/mevalonate kinase-like predicted kinase
MRAQLCQKLKDAQERNSLPQVVAYQRIDGPGSSLDLREFQQALWQLPSMPADFDADPTLSWTRALPRTVAITIDTGTKVTAYPFKSDYIAVESKDYKTMVTSRSGEVLPIKENWLLKILDLFNLSGVMFVLENLCPGIKSAGLGGSATAATGVCILANELAGKPFNEIQLISIASRIEQDLGISIVGTQEQSNVVFGGVTDYVWFPWGIPGRSGAGYGESLRSELIRPKDYWELESRMAIFHTGKVRQSTDVNSVWRKALSTPEGYELHKKKPEIAYQFREGLRLGKWDQVADSIFKYREIRITLCPGYMAGAEEISKLAEANECLTFPLGAGGGGAILVFSANPESLQRTREELKSKYNEITFKIKDRGHVFKNLPIAW